MELPEGLKLDDYEKPRRRIVEFIRDYVSKTGLAGVVLGLSGGIDSSLVATLACEALGPDKVLGLMLPVDAKKDKENVKDARNLAELLRMSYDVFELKRAVAAFDPLYLEKVALGNLTARLRMTTWYARANQENRLVLGTGNKSEILTGYFTKYGDAGVDILPLGELYKVNVWGLAEHIGVPQHIIKKTPSAGLWADQTDEGEMGVTYKELDSILFLRFDRGLSPEEIASRGHALDTVGKVMALVERSQHKRDPIPRAQL